MHFYKWTVFCFSIYYTRDGSVAYLFGYHFISDRKK